MSQTPYVTGSALISLVQKLAPTAFNGTDVTVSANYGNAEPSIEFGIFHLENTRFKGARTAFMGHIRRDAETLAERLEDARNNSRNDGRKHLVLMDGLDIDPSWPVLRISVHPASA